VAPLIKDYVQRSSVPPVLFCYFGAASQYESKMNPFHDDCVVLFFKTSEEFTALTKQVRPRVLLSNSILKFPDLDMNASVDLLHALRIRFYYLQYSIDPICSLPTQLTKQCLLGISKFFFFSEYWRNEFLKIVKKNFSLNRDESELLAGRTSIAGPYFIDFSSIGERKRICRKYGLDSAHRYLFFDPPGYADHVPNFFYKYYFHPNWYSRFRATSKDLRAYSADTLYSFPRFIQKLKHNELRISAYPQLLKEIRQFAERHDFLIISKLRKKHVHPSYVQQAIDLTFYDNSYHPSALHELLSISDCYVGFNSTASIEAAMFGCPVQLFQIFPEEFRYAPYGGDVYSFINQWLTQAPSPFNYPGVSEVCFWNQDSKLLLDQKEISNLDESVTKAFAKNYLGLPSDILLESALTETEND